MSEDLKELKVYKDQGCDILKSTTAHSTTATQQHKDTAQVWSEWGS